MTTWLTADQHFGHKNIITYCQRPFADVEEMARDLVARHNAIVSTDDLVIHVGDFSLRESFVPEVLPLLVGRKILVPGNHDACHPKHRGHASAVQRYLAWGFETIIPEMRLGEFTVAHMPYVGDHTEVDRYERWRPKDEGRWLLHGHVHDAWRERGRQINVGVDARGYAPVSLAEVEKLAHGQS